MIIFRPHRGGIVESMAEAKEFNNVREMKRYIVEIWHEGWTGKRLFTMKDIVIDETRIVDDRRTGWKDTKYVCVKRMGDKDYIKEHGIPQCIGMCATKYDKSKKLNL